MITTRTLSNGVRMVMEEMPELQSISIGVFVKTGAVNENAKNAGISHFVEHMMFKGTSHRSAREIAADIDAIGGQINAFTGKEATCYYVKSVAENYQAAADVIVDMLENSLFEKKELDRERQVVCEEIKMTKDSPDDLAHDTFLNQMFKGDSFGRSILGTPTTLKGITHNVMADYVKKQYTRDSMVVSVAGRFDPDELCGYFEDKFLSLEGTKPEPVLEHPEFQPTYRSLIKDIQQSHLCLGTRTIPVTDPRFYSMQIANNILGGSMSSRLFQNIREEKGLAYSVYSMHGTFSTAGYFEIYAGVAHEKIRHAIEGIREEITKLKEMPVTEEELAASREQMKSTYVFSQESTSTRMVVNGKNFLLQNRVYRPDEVIQHYNNVTIESIEEAKELITDFSQYTATVVSGKKVNVKSMMGA